MNKRSDLIHNIAKVIDTSPQHILNLCSFKKIMRIEGNLVNKYISHMLIVCFDPDQKRSHQVKERLIKRVLDENYPSFTLSKFLTTLALIRGYLGDNTYKKLFPGI